MELEIINAFFYKKKDKTLISISFLEHFNDVKQSNEMFFFLSIKILLICTLSDVSHFTKTPPATVPVHKGDEKNECFSGGG